MSTEKQKGKIADVNGVMVLGAESVSTRFLELLADINIEYPDNGMESVIIIEAADTPFRFGHLEGRQLSINLANHVDEALEMSLEAQSHLSLRALIWHNLVVTLFHEVAHLEELRENPDAYPDGETPEIDEATTVKAQTMILDFVKKGYNIEPPLVWEMPFFHGCIEEHMVRFRDSVDPWCRNQVYMAENGLIYHDPDKGISIMSMREYEQRFLPQLLGEYGYTVDGKMKEEAKVNTTEVIALTNMTNEELEDLDMFESFEEIDTEDLDEGDMFDDAIESGTIGVQETQPWIPPAAPAQTTSFVAPPPPPANNQPWVAPPPPATANFKPNTLTPDAAAVVAQAVYLRLFNHIFTNCGWTGTGFTNMAAVLTPVDISDIPMAVDLIHSYDTQDPQGNKVRNLPCSGQIRGEIFGTAQLPGYTLNLTIGSAAHVRRLVPQNPNKMRNGQLTKTAAAAKNGARIAWLINTEAADTGKFVMKIENGNIIPL